MSITSTTISEHRAYFFKGEKAALPSFCKGVGTLQKLVVEALECLDNLFSLNLKGVGACIKRHKDFVAPRVETFPLFGARLPKNFEEKAPFDAFNDLVAKYFDEKDYTPEQARRTLNKGISKGICFGEVAFLHHSFLHSPSMSIAEAVEHMKANQEMLPFLEACDIMLDTFFKKKNAEGIATLKKYIPVTEKPTVLTVAAGTSPLANTLEGQLEESSTQTLLFSCENKKECHIYLLRFNETTGEYSFYDSQTGGYSYSSKENLLEAFGTYVGSRTSYLNAGTTWQIETFA